MLFYILIKKMFVFSCLWIILIISASRPAFEKRREDVEFYNGDPRRILECTTKAFPVPKMHWEKNGSKISSADKSMISTSDVGITQLSFRSVKNSYEGNYTCVAVNKFGTAKKTFSVRVVDPPNNAKYYVAVIGIPIILVSVGCGLVLAYLYVQYRNNWSIISKRQYEAFMKGNPGETACSEHNYAFNPYNREYEIPISEISVDHNKILGQGQHGIVFMGKVGIANAAVKTTKDGSEKEYILGLMSELKILIHIGVHAHIAGLIGACTAKIRKGTFLLALEFYPNGNLLKHLRKCHQFVDRNSQHIDARSYKTLSQSDSGVILSADLVKWTFQLANGMSYLASKMVVHGDLAARNILLDQDFHVKISDFGLSRRIYEYGIYKKTNVDEPLPWRWMSIEAIRTFSTMSDVWSFGVTLWEIFSLGDIPYPGYRWNEEFLNELLGGFRMAKPKHANDKMYEIMLACWCDVPEERISFRSLHDILRPLYETCIPNSEENESSYSIFDVEG